MNLTTVRMMRRSQGKQELLEEMEFIGQKTIERKQDGQTRSALGHLRFSVIYWISQLDSLFQLSLA